MKLFILKLLSLVVVCLGVVSLAVAMGIPEARVYLEKVPALLAEWQTKLPPQLAFLQGILTVQGLWFTGSIAAIVFGIYGFFPRLAARRRPKKIVYEGPHGEVQIQLESVEHSLNHVLARMPEIKRINVRVDPHDNGRRAYIRADVVLNQQPGQNARAIASLVSDYIAETATKLLGLEELATIDLNVTGINVNSKKSSQAIRKESLSHSGNAPVELLEAAPAPLGLAGPREPLGSGPIEDELDDDSEAEALEAEAIDIRHETANQAAARSELLEPLSMSAPRRGEDLEDSPAGELETAAEEAAPVEAPTVVEAGVAPLDMDVLHESLEASGDDAEYVELDQDEDEGEGAVPNSYEAAGGGGHDAGDEALDDDPAYSGELVEEDDFTPESPEASPFSEPNLDGEGDPNESGFQPGGHVEEFGEAGDDSLASSEPDSGEGHAEQGGLTIPESGEDAGERHEPEKKRWGWFN